MCISDNKDVGLAAYFGSWGDGGECLTLVTLYGQILEAVENEKSLGLAYHTSIKVRCDNNFRNPQGEMESHVYEVYLWQGICRSVLSHLKKNSDVAIKGRLEQLNGDLVIVAEQIELFSN